jgi:hypothetical protein
MATTRIETATAHVPYPRALTVIACLALAGAEYWHSFDGRLWRVLTCESDGRALTLRLRRIATYASA